MARAWSWPGKGCIRGLGFSVCVCVRAVFSLGFRVEGLNVAGFDCVL